MSSQSKPVSGLRLSLLVACLPAIASVLFFRWGMSKSKVIEIVESPIVNTTLVEQSDGTLQTSDDLKEIYARGCPKYDYKVRIFSHDPLIIYVEDFISERERSYIVALADEYYQQSQVVSDDNISYASEDRTSQSAFIYFDPVANCIRQRAADFQGGIHMDNMEELQAVKYRVGKQFRNHYDWGIADANPRISTFFVYAACDQSMEDFANSTQEANRNPKLTPCEGGATNFPDYEGENPISWCDVIDCEDEDQLGGVSFKAIPGNAVFWSNVYPNGTYHPGTMHAGVPVKSGTKVGLNIWTRRNPFNTETDAPLNQELDSNTSEKPEAELSEESEAESIAEPASESTRELEAEQSDESSYR